MSDNTQEQNGLGEEERDLLARITVQIERCLEFERRYGKRRRVLILAATGLRLGKRASVVLAEIQAEIPEAVVTVQEPL